MQMNARQIGDRGLVEAAASRAAVPVYHTGQGQDEHAAAHATCCQHHLPLHGLDSAWSWSGNPHRESGTRWRAAADVGQAARLGESLCTVGGRNVSGTVWATPLEHRISALARNLAAR